MYGPYAMANEYHIWKMVPLLSNFWNQFTLRYTIHVLESRYWLLVLQISVLGYSELFSSPFSLISYIPSITDFLVVFHSFTNIYICWVSWVIQIFFSGFWSVQFIYRLCLYQLASSQTENIYKSPKVWYSRWKSWRYFSTVLIKIRKKIVLLNNNWFPHWLWK